MAVRRVLLYFAWSRPGEAGAPYLVIDDRFPAIFELRRLFYPAFEPLADPAAADQGIAGFLDHVQKPNFAVFAEQMSVETARATIQIERVADDGFVTALDEAILSRVDTVVVISFDSFRTGQSATEAEVAAVRHFLQDPDHLIFVCPHHDIGEAYGVAADMIGDRRVAEHLHHGDKAIPPRQGFGGFARSLLAGLGVPVENCFGLHPASEADGAPSPIDAERGLDRLRLLESVETFNLHAHLPQLERTGGGLERLDVLARQRVDMTMPPHPFTADGRDRFDALLQSTEAAFPGTLLVCDTTMFSSTAGGVDSLRRLWSNIARRAVRSGN